MGISKISYGSGDNLFEISYKDDEVITDSGANSYMSDNFEANSFAAYQNKSQTQFFEAGPNSDYNNATEHNCMWRKWDGNNKTDLFPGADNPDGYYTFNSLLTDYNGRRIITELTDIQRVVWRPEIMEETVNTRINGVVTNVLTYRINTNTNQYYCDIIDVTNPTHYTAQNAPIFPWLLYPQDKKQLQLHYNRHDGISPWGNSCTREAGARNTGDNNVRTYPLSTAMVNYDVPTGNNQNFGFYSDDNKYFFHCTLSTNNYASGDVRCYICSEDELKKWLASSGLKFIYKNRMYKPVVENSVIVGYTDDLSSQSEWDEWHTKDDHEKPVTPPTPPTPDNPWDVDPETYGWSGGEVSGMVKYYLLTAGQMSSLQSAIASNANWTIDYLNCIVSCFVVPNSGIFFDAPIPTTVKFKLDNATEWDTGVGCSRIQGTKNKSGGTIDIPRLTNTFYDFEPYSDYSVYIPFCGRVPIKGNVCLGHEIKVTYYPDVPTCSLTAVVSCGGATIAIAKGSFGTMTPVTSNGSDRKTAAVIGDVAPIITGIGTGIVGVALGNPLIVGAGAAQALGGIMGGVKETVQSYAYSVGSTGDSSFFSAGNRCYYYANYPLIDEVVNNSMFGHSVGYLCNTVGKLSEFHGFTICANPHVTFSATAEEREEIERLLSMGVILPDGE